ncbi:MAG: methyltransferase domain-containing protein [Candidatus Omnitrophica bacterium]|nr:methyltransferase domain-containing protein [Candidatus Omnitrophota bacterium]
MSVLKFIKNLIQKKNTPPEIGKIYFGDLNRLSPIAEDWGFSRGGAIDRYYIENFILRNAFDIKGHALEIKDDNYLVKYGGNKVLQKDILDVDPNNSKATIIADLSNADQIPSNTYDCFVLTQTLQLIFDLNAAIEHIYRILKPGGVLLLTLPGISHFPNKTDSPIRYWSFTESSVRKILEKRFLKERINTEIYGNVKVTASFLYGVGLKEISQNDLDYRDPNYQLIISAKAVK